MALNPVTKQKRDQKILKRFEELSSKRTKNGKRLMTYEAIYEQLADEFNLSESWIERLVKQ